MSQKIAPGQWDPDTRKQAKWIAPIAGAVLVIFGAVMLNTLVVASVRSDGDIPMIAAALALIPMGLGAAALVPNVVVPIVYRVLDKWEP